MEKVGTGSLDPKQTRPEPSSSVLDYSKQARCLRCSKVYDNYKFSGIMISLCKDCRWPKKD